MQFHKYRIQPSEGKASMMYMDGYTLNNTKYMSENKNSKPIPSQTLHRLIYSVSQEECARLQEGVPYVKIYQYNPKHLFQSWTVTEITAREFWNFDICYTLTDYQIHIETGRNMWLL